MARALLSHAHILDIIDDHQLLWYTAESNVERQQVAARLRRQLALAGVNFASLEAAFHGLSEVVVHPLYGGTFLVVGAAIFILTLRGR